jgi:3-methyladenine DNA glycosylase AlkD
MPVSDEITSIEDLAKEIAKRLRALPSSKTEAVRAVRREYSKRLARVPAAFVIELAMRLLSEPGISRFVAYELVKHHPAAASSLREKQLERFGRGMSEWGEVDCFACYLAGPAWREHQVSDKVIHRWAHSKDRWWRRAALVSTVPLNTKAQGGSGDTRRTLEVCRMLLADTDDMVVKAMSWALRELSKRDDRAVRQFLIDHRGQIASRVKREVANKLATGLKNPKQPAK